MKSTKLGEKLAYTSLDGGSMILGGMLASGIEGAVPIEEPKTRKAAVSVLSFLGAALVKGDTLKTRALRNFLLGAGVRQAQRFIQEAATPSLPEADGTNKFLHDMFETGGGEVTTDSPQKRMGMGYRFTPQRQVGTTAYPSAAAVRQPQTLDFPLT